MENIEVLKQALPYIRQYRGKTFVIKVGGELLQADGFLDRLSHDVALLYQLNIRVVIIHGGGPQLSEMAEKIGIESVKVNGRRITDDRMIEVANMVFSGASTDILGALRSHGTPGVGLSGVDGDLVQATRRPPVKLVDRETGQEREVDFQNVGDIETVDSKVLNVLLDNRFVPVVAPLGADLGGKVLNINADTVAGAIAKAVNAKRLMMLTDITGVVDKNGDLIAEMTDDQAKAMIADGSISGGMIPKIETCLGAVEANVEGAVIIDGRVPHAILIELFTAGGAGTLITPGSP